MVSVATDEDPGHWMPPKWPLDLWTQFTSRNRTEDQWDNVTSMSVEGVRCYLNFWDTPYPEGLHCNSTWDDVTCWPTTPANRSVYRPCSDLISLPGHDIPAEAFSARAFRVCDGTGHWKWEKTNYSACLALLPPAQVVVEERQDAEVIAYVMFVGSMLSFFALTICMFIFSYFKTLKCDRVTVHLHLAMSLLIRVLLNIVLTEPIISHRDSASYADIQWLCKFILVAKMYTTLTSVNWMFIEGLYLHSRLVTSVFSSRTPFKVYYSLGWGMPMVVVTSWAVALHGVLEKPCWKGFGELNLIWILAVPMYVALAMNLLFLINIIRILVTKLRASVAVETAQVRKAMKATLVLFPLLGLPNLFVAINPQDQGDLEDVYLLMNAVLESSQGVFFAVLYCFTNNEVHEAIAKHYSRYWMRMNPQCNDKRRQSSRSVSLLERKLKLEGDKRSFWTRCAFLYQTTENEGCDGQEETELQDECAV